MDDERPARIPSLALVVAILATLALGTRAPPRRPPVEPGLRPAPRGVLRAGDSVDLNTATAEEIEALPRVGPALARRIVAHREANGPFAGPDDLDRVTGVGPALLERLAPIVRFGADQNRSRSQPIRSWSATDARPGTTSSTNP